MTSQKQQPDQERIKMLRKKLVEEETINLNIISIKSNQCISYGDQIQLIHVDSQEFIRSRTVVAEIDKSCNRVQLTNQDTRGIVFKILPRYKYRQEGEKVQISDQIVFFNLKLKLYLHVTTKPAIKVNPMSVEVHNVKMSADAIETERRSRPQQFAKLYEVNLSTNPISRIQVLPFYKYEDGKVKYIKSSMLIRLQHTQLRGFLASDGTDYTGDGLAQVFVRTTHNSEQQDEQMYISTNSIFEIEIACPMKKGQQNDSSKIQNRGRICTWHNETVVDGKQIKVPSVFRLRHFNTGRLVRAQVVQSQGQNKKESDQFDTLGLADHLDETNLDQDEFDDDGDSHRSAIARKHNPKIKRKNAGVKTLSSIDVQNQWRNTGFVFQPTNVESSQEIREGACVKLITSLIPQYEDGSQASPKKKYKGEIQRKFVSVTDVNWDQGESSMTMNDVNKSNFGRSQTLRIQDSKLIEKNTSLTGAAPIRAASNAVNLSVARKSSERKSKQKLPQENFLQFESEYLGVQRRQVKLINKNYNQDAYILLSVDQNQARDLMFAHSYLSELHQISKSFEMGLITQPIIQRAIKILSDLIFFVTNSDDQSAFTCQGIPFKERQKILRQLDVCSLLASLLQSPFNQNGLFKLQEIRKDHSITKCCILCYRLIKHTVKDNRLNELYASNWIDLFFDQAMQTGDQNDIKAENTITELISNNKRLLEQQISEQTIIKFINLCRNQKNHRRFIDLLTALCSTLGRAVPSNQSLICKNIYEDQNSSQDMVMKLFYNNAKPLDKQVRVMVRQDYFEGQLDLIDFFNITVTHSDSRLYQYFISMINLSAQLCFQRNGPVMNTLNDIYPFNLALSVVSCQKHQHKIRSAFMNLMMTLHIDKQPLQLLIVPKLPRVVSDIHLRQNQIELPTCQAPIPFSLLQLKQFAYNYLDGIKGVIHAYDQEKNQMIFQVLRLVKFMLQCGFYQSSDEIHMIMKPLIALLDGSTDDYNPMDKYGYGFDKYLENRDNTPNTSGMNRRASSPFLPGANANMFAKAVAQYGKNGSSNNLMQDMEMVNGGGNNKNLIQNNGERYEQNEHNLIVMSCKRLICQILLKMHDMENDMQISFFLKELKIHEIKRKKLQQNSRFNSSQTKRFKRKSTMSKKSDLHANIFDQDDMRGNKQSSQKFDVFSSPSKAKNKIMQVELEDLGKKSTQKDSQKYSKNIQIVKAEEDEESILNSNRQGSARQQSSNKTKKNGKTLYELIEERQQEDILESRRQIPAFNWISKAIQQSGFHWEEKDKLVCILLDLVLYQDPNLVRLSFELLFKMFGRYQNLSNLIKRVQLMEHPQAIEIIAKVDQSLLELEKLYGTRHQWLGDNGEESLEFTQNGINIVIFLMNLLREEIKPKPINDTIPQQDIDESNRVTPLARKITEPEKELVSSAFKRNQGLDKNENTNETKFFPPDGRIPQQDQLSEFLSVPQKKDHTFSELLNLASGIIVDNDEEDKEKDINIKNYINSEHDEESNFHKLSTTALIDNAKKLSGESDQIFLKAECPNLENQRLYRNLNVQRIIINFLEHKNYAIPGYSRASLQIRSDQGHNSLANKMAAERRENKQNTKESLKIFNQFVDVCYLMLIRFCRYNQANQSILYKDLNIFLRDIEKSHLAIYLIQEIFRNNGKLVESEFNKTITTLCNFIDGLKQQKSSKAADFLKVLKVFILCRDKIIKQHQQQIIVQLATSQQGRLMDVITQPDKLKKLIEQAKSEEGTLRKAKSQKVKLQLEVGPELNYAIELLNLLALCCEGNNEDARQKCKQYLKIETLIELISQAEFIWPLKQGLVLFLHNVYLIDIRMNLPTSSMYGGGTSNESQFSVGNFAPGSNFGSVVHQPPNLTKEGSQYGGKKMGDLMSTGGGKQKRSSRFNFQSQQLNGIMATSLIEQFLGDIQYWVLSAPTSENTFRSLKFPDNKQISLKAYSLVYCYSNILPTLLTMMENNQWTMLSPENIERLTKVVVAMYYNSYVPTFRTFAYHLLKCIFDSPFLSNYLDNVKHPIGADDDEIGGIIENQTSNKYSSSDAAKLNAEKQEQQARQANSLSKLLCIHLKELFLSEKFKQKKELEFEELVIKVKHIQKETKKNLKIKVDFKKLIESMLNMFITDRSLPIPLQVNCLKIFRKLIEIQNPNKSKPAAQWDTSEWSKYDQQIKQAQDQLCRLKVCQKICQIFRDSQNRDDQYRVIRDECLLTFIALTLGGNQKAQLKFYDFLFKDESNKLILNLKNLFMSTFQEVRNYISQEIAIGKSKRAKEKKQNQKIKNDGGIIKMKTLARQATVVAHQMSQSRPVGRVSFGDMGLVKSGSIKKDQSRNLGLSRIDQSQSQSSPSRLKNNTTFFNTQLEQTNILMFESQIADDDQDPANISDFSLPRGEQAMITCMNILRFLQLLCQNHNSKLQDFLRVQDQEESVNGKNFDFVTYTATIYGIYQRNCIHAKSCVLGYQIIETLTQFVQGPCPENQKTLVSGKVIDISRDLLSQFDPSNSKSRQERIRLGFTDQKIALIDELKSKGVTLMLSLLQGDVEIEYVKRMTTALDNFQILFERMELLYREFVANDLKLSPDSASLSKINSLIKKEHFEGSISDGFDLYILISTLADFLQEAHVKMKQGESQNPKSFAFFKHHTGRIQVLNGDRLQRVYFPINPMCKHLSKSTKDHVMQGIDRQSAQTKIIDFLKAVPDLIDQMQHVEKLSRSEIKITPTTINILQNITLFIAILINALLLAFYTRDEVGTTGYVFSSAEIPSWLQIALIVLGTILAVISVIILIGWYITKAVLLIKQKWRERIKNNRTSYYQQGRFNQLQQIENRQTIPAKNLPLNQARKILALKGPDAEEFNLQFKRSFGHAFVKFEYYWKSFLMFLVAPTFMYMTYCIIITILGLQVSPFFYTLHLLDVITRIPTLRNVIQAVTKNYKQLLLTAMLGLIIIYVFSVIAYIFLYDMYFDEDINIFDQTDKGDSICYTLTHCLLSNLNYGLRMGGGIGEFLSPVSWNNKSDFFLRFFFDMFYFVIVTFTLLNIIFGIIIDTFAELRDAKKKIDQDIKNKCFICNLDRYTFDRNANGFEHHQQNDHETWSYLYFIIHLNTKDSTDFNGTESYIYEKLLKDDITWLPLHRAIVLDKKNLNEDDYSQAIDAFDRLNKVAESFDTQIQSLIQQNKKNKGI